MSTFYMFTLSQYWPLASTVSSVPGVYLQYIYEEKLFSEIKAKGGC